MKKLEEDLSSGIINSQNKSMERILEVGLLAPALTRSQPPSAHEDVSMLRVICQQRDRFKQRIVELEAENKSLTLRIDKINSELESLRGDNLRLFEKIRFLQSYKSQVNHLLLTISLEFRSIWKPITVRMIWKRNIPICMRIL